MGIVQQYNSSTGEHLLQYEDDDTEWVKIGESNTTVPSLGPGRASPDDGSLLESMPPVMDESYASQQAPVSDEHRWGGHGEAGPRGAPYNPYGSAGPQGHPGGMYPPHGYYPGYHHAPPGAYPYGPPMMGIPHGMPDSKGPPQQSPSPTSVSSYETIKASSIGSGKAHTRLLNFSFYNSFPLKNRVLVDLNERTGQRHGPKKKIHCC
jgi:hypothetical protein